MKKLFEKHGVRIVFTILFMYATLATLFVYKHRNDSDVVRNVVLGEQVKDLSEFNAKDDSVVEIIKGDYDNFLELNGLPSLERMAKEEADVLVNGLKSIKRLYNLGYTPDNFLTPELDYKLLYTDVKNTLADRDYSNYYEFDGSSISELNKFLKGKKNAFIKIVSRNVAWDETLKPPSNVAIDADGVEFTFDEVLDKAIHIIDVENVSIVNFNYDTAMYNWGIFIARSNGISIRNTTVNNARYKGIVVLGENSYVEISGCTVNRSGNGGIFFDGNIGNCIVENNRVENTQGTTNYSAGILFGGAEVLDYDTAYNPYDETPVDIRYNTPHNIVIKDNYVYMGNSSGIYSDGAYRCFIIGNTCYLNDKEGMCLDTGTFGCYVNGNTIRQNGGRRRQTREDLENDYVGAFGQLSDGSSPAKLPGLSIDNGSYNIISSNYVYDNYGSGIKMVRSCARNIIMNNIVTSNNRGQSETFHFFGIELGHASTPDYETHQLDFTACFENIVCRNVVTGGHYAGIFMAEECYINDFYDNVIMDSVFWSMESLSDKYNATSNNISDISSRGIDLSNTNGGNVMIPQMVN